MNIYLAELVGTALLIIFGNGVVVLSRSKGQNGGWIVVTAGWGMGVMLAVYSVAQVSGAHINPAVTLGLASIGAFSWPSVPGYILAQMAGAFLGSVVVYLSYLAHWGETKDQAAKLACYCTAPAIRRFGPAFITETIGTAVLVFCVLALGKVGVGAEIEEAWNAAVSTWFGPLVAGLLVFGIGLSLGGPTGYAINPARDLGPRLAHALLPIRGKGPSDWSYAWVPVAAPVAGGVLGAQLFVILGF